MSVCGLFSISGTGACVWCGHPREVHEVAECDACDGWGFTEGFDREPVRCGQCVRGRVRVEGRNVA